jgi:rhodanese-related sulfurtransferase
MNAAIPIIAPRDVLSLRGATLVDVRMPEEYVGELGHIAGALLKTLGPELDQYLEKLNRSDTIISSVAQGHARAERPPKR